ncbi:hypothetical protein IFM89_019733 [Coptis chinensis]|uniref:Uncharacterized protein n=1 Tax=Coptis chinensis TaxID=261450 RepID=A0A835LMS6_9MAGN|nr:hypothetical protein IFM89_019733 [Coptis chinensis]
MSRQNTRRLWRCFCNGYSGSIFHYFKGMKNPPNGYRMSGAFQNMRINAPRTGGFSLGWFVFCFDCYMVFLREKEDHYNSIIAAATGAFVQLRRGLRPMCGSAVVGGVFLALIEGVNIAVNSFVTQLQEEQKRIDMEENMRNNSGGLGGSIGEPQFALEEANDSSSLEQGGSTWFGRLFRGGKKEENASSESVTGILECDLPVVPIPSFD